MSFREQSAWVMALLMIATGLYYGWSVAAASRAIGATAPAIVVIGYVFWLVVGSIVIQVALALSSPKEATAPADERERSVEQRAGNWSGFVLAAGAVLALGHFLVSGDGNMLFHLVMTSLIVSQIADYSLQILLLRRSL